MKVQSKHLNVYLILAGENLFHPYYFQGLVNSPNKNFAIVGVTIAKDKLPKGRLDFFIKMYQLWGLSGFILIGLLSKIRSLQGKDLQNIANKYNIPITISDNVNSEDHLAYLRQKNIDIIVSSNGQIFKKHLLQLPKIACINRHTALLPDYAGVLPVFWAMLENNKRFGITIHYMVEKIDEGKPIIQRIIPLIKTNSLFANYMIAFHESIYGTIDAIDKVKKNKERINNSKKVKYHSFPSKLQMAEFHKNHKAISVRDMFNYITRMY